MNNTYTELHPSFLVTAPLFNIHSPSRGLVGPFTAGSAQLCDRPAQWPRGCLVGRPQMRTHGGQCIISGDSRRLLTKCTVRQRKQNVLWSVTAAILNDDNRAMRQSGRRRARMWLGLLIIQWPHVAGHWWPCRRGARGTSCRIKLLH